MCKSIYVRTPPRGALWKEGEKASGRDLPAVMQRTPFQICLRYYSTFGAAANSDKKHFKYSKDFILKRKHKFETSQHQSRHFVPDVYSRLGGFDRFRSALSATDKEIDAFRRYRGSVAFENVAANVGDEREKRCRCSAETLQERLSSLPVSSSSLHAGGRRRERVCIAQKGDPETPAKRLFQYGDARVVNAASPTTSSWLHLFRSA